MGWDSLGPLPDAALRAGQEQGEGRLQVSRAGGGCAPQTKDSWRCRKLGAWGHCSLTRAQQDGPALPGSLLSRMDLHAGSPFAREGSGPQRTHPAACGRAGRQGLRTLTAGTLDNTSTAGPGMGAQLQLGS